MGPLSGDTWACLRSFAQESEKILKLKDRHNTDDDAHPEQYSDEEAYQDPDQRHRGNNRFRVFWPCHSCQF